MWMWFAPPLRSPTLISGATWLIAEATTASIRNLTSAMPPQGEVSRALMMLRSGAITVIGLKEPWLIGVSGSRKALTMVPTPLSAIAGPQLVGPLVCAEVPVKSATIVSPATVSLRRTTSGSGFVPSLSI